MFLRGSYFVMDENERSSLEKVILAGIGAITKTAETAGDLLEELVKKGELTVEQGKAINEELKHGIKEGVSNATQAVQSSAVSKFVDNMDRLTPEELAKIREKMEQMEQVDQVEQMDQMEQVEQVDQMESGKGE